MCSQSSQKVSVWRLSHSVAGSSMRQVKRHFKAFHLSHSLLARLYTTRKQESELYCVLKSPRSVWVGASMARRRPCEAEHVDT